MSWYSIYTYVITHFEFNIDTTLVFTGQHRVTTAAAASTNTTVELTTTTMKLSSSQKEQTVIATVGSVLGSLMVLILLAALSVTITVVVCQHKNKSSAIPMGHNINEVSDTNTCTTELKFIEVDTNQAYITTSILTEPSVAYGALPECIEVNTNQAYISPHECIEMDTNQAYVTNSDPTEPIVAHDYDYIVL